MLSAFKEILNIVGYLPLRMSLVMSTFMHLIGVASKWLLPKIQ